MKMPPTTCKALLKDYCSNCTFAGVHFIADDTKHWFERLVWVALVALSWYGSAILIIAAWDAFRESPISFGVETTYTKWETKLPSVAVCETENTEKLYSVCDTIWPPGHLLDLEDTLKDLAYFRGISYSLTEVCAISNPDPMCLMSNYSYYANLVRSGCQEIITNCSYNDVPFNCCEYFQPIDTDMGACFIINSIQTKKPKLLPMISNMRSKSSILKFEVLLPSTMYTLNKEEVPSITSLQSSAMHLQLGHKYRRQVAVRDIDNDLLIVETTPEQRACRFHSENKDGLYPHYSYSACTVLCRKRAQLEVCNCNDHFMLGTPESDRCNVSGLACIHAHASHLTTLKPPWANRPGLSCDCLPSCEETEITIIKDVDVSLRSKKEKTKAYVEMVLAFLPTERFKRIVVRSRLDLVVSIGGTTGLFVGASLLSFVELIIYFTVRFAINIWLERQGRTNKVVIKEDGEDLSNDDILIVFQNRNQGLGYLNGGLHVHDQSDY
ncbi:sodium channel protein Nach-like isoform X1 [Choristoneura fumiferana]|uniref:sodium channel protein Nach-like isoform X1 n=1 Tax=Choristoneura fumiferana TaxID=7141 RepID=UPI003D159E9B